MDALSRSYWDVDRANIWHPLTRHSTMEGTPFPMITRGEGVYLFDVEGNRYIDAISSWWSCNIGHSHPRVVAAIRRQAERLQHSILANRTHPRAIELASRLTSLFEDQERRVLFASDGASAVEAALRVAAQYWYNTGRPERCRFAALRGGYHGDTFGAMSVGFVENFHAAYKPLLFDSFQAERPYCVECPYNCDPETCEAPCFEHMNTVIKQHQEELCAVIIEPLVQGAGGMHIYPTVYLRKLAQACAEHDILLIADEIATGYGRTGSMFAFEQAGISPDMVCLGKNMSGGALPLSALVVKDNIYDAFADTSQQDGTLYHGHTFAGNPIACAAALACLDVFNEQNLIERSRERGARLYNQLRGFTSVSGVKNVRSLGMLGAFELEDTENGTGTQRAQNLSWKLYEKRVLLRPLGNIVYLMLPLVATEAELDTTLSNLYEVTEEV